MGQLPLLPKPTLVGLRPTLVLPPETGPVKHDELDLQPLFGDCVNTNSPHNRINTTQGVGKRIMSVPPSSPASRRCWPLTIVVSILGACVIVPLCLFTVIQLDAGYWYLLRNVAGARAAQAQGQSPQESTPVSQTPDEAVAPPAGEVSAAAARGAEIFSDTSCSSCHSLEPGRTVVGPSMAGVGERASSTVSDVSAADYLHQSIVDPDAHIVDGFPAHVMPDSFEKQLTPEQIDDLVAFLLTQ